MEFSTSGVSLHVKSSNECGRHELQVPPSLKPPTYEQDYDEIVVKFQPIADIEGCDYLLPMSTDDQQASTATIPVKDGD